MFRWNGIRRSIVPLGGVLVLLTVWALHSSTNGGSEATTKAVPTVSRESTQPGPLPPAPTSPPPVPPGPPPPPTTESLAAKPPDRIEIRKLVEDGLTECRLALMYHERGAGEKAYRSILKYRDLALACARAFLKEATDPSVRKAAERTVDLLSQPPTHGLLSHFEW